MSSELQLDVRRLSRWRRHLVNAYEVKAGVVFIAGKSVWSMPERFKVVCNFVYHASRYTSALLYLSFRRGGWAGGHHNIRQQRRKRGGKGRSYWHFFFPQFQPWLCLWVQPILAVSSLHFKDVARIFRGRVCGDFLRACTRSYVWL